MQKLFCPIEQYLSTFVQATTQQLDEDKDSVIKQSSDDHNHLAQWVRNSHRQLSPMDSEMNCLDEWSTEEFTARSPRDFLRLDSNLDDGTTVNSDSTSSASLNTVKSSGTATGKKSDVKTFSRENSSGSINICRGCHRLDCKIDHCR